MTDAPNEQPTPFDLNSDDVAARKRADLKRLFPEVFNEDQIDLDQLRRVMGEWVDEGTERFGLTWPGKAACMKIIQAPATGALRPDRDESVNFDESENVFIEGDNLEVLKLLQKAYFGKIKMIYIDPPYNTGNEFIYPDSYAENLDTYLAYTGQSDDEGRRFATNSEGAGRFHSRWLNMMFPRLYVAKNLLKDDGLIFISIDDNEQPHLRKLCDQVFGEENFVDSIVWKKRYGGGAKEKYLVTAHEYVLVYAKDLGNLPNIFVSLSDDAIDRYYKLRDKKYETRGPYRTHPLEAMKSFDERENLRFAIPAPDGTDVFPKRQWRWGKKTAFEALEKGEIEFTKDRDDKWILSSKQYLKDENGEVRKTKFLSVVDNAFSQHGTSEIFDIFGDAKIFDFPKPTVFLKQLIEVGTDGAGDEIVLDFFAGSNATGHAIFALNAEDGGRRRLISVQLPEKLEEDSAAAKAGFRYISDISKERLRRTGKRFDKALADFGFRAFKLTESAFHRWDADSSNDERDLLCKIESHASNIKEAGDEDILFEILLKDGFELTTKVESLDVAAGRVYSVADSALLINLERNLTKELIDAIADLAEEKDAARVVCLDAGFQGNDQLKTNAVQTFKSRLGHGEDGSMFRTV
jgi:adenine-specific DNA-methyltransferase